MTADRDHLPGPASPPPVITILSRGRGVSEPTTSTAGAVSVETKEAIWELWSLSQEGLEATELEKLRGLLEEYRGRFAVTDKECM